MPHRYKHAPKLGTRGWLMFDHISCRANLWGDRRRAAGGVDGVDGGGVAPFLAAALIVTRGHSATVWRRQRGGDMTPDNMY